MSFSEEENVFAVEVNVSVSVVGSFSGDAGFGRFRVGF